MRKFILLVFSFFLLLIPQDSFARSVSYVGGWTLVEDFDFEKFSTLVHYTPHPKYSIGYRYAFNREEEWHFNGAHLNYLAKRWNQTDGQGNFYLHSGLGHVYSDFEGLEEESELAFYTGLSLDWENRRFFVSYNNHYMNIGKIDNFFEQKGRLGLAPYIAEYGGIHTWLMTEVKYGDERDEKWTVTPLVRIFKGAYMAEIGWTIDEGPMANLRILF